ncbi:2',3'-cyclic-nucleotide 2'-phosphodiesterase/3'-nucleotidase [Paenibacillus sp. JGP012]|uniref:5'-nucleotidase C-terminal domain-containing protein n=1 Tax=Paenibacillus sp. JGP012 TaxID=2735914 RepID=UPI00161390B6|nr:5'-nucleotidase C-terminal domain-containing protein [Paenibacillus sp. JGP012]MBB6019568.1 2',3'-cyclic-nucleotide 2'-phosphodiesterase/3'-nucleotidase [Paenibacillus sp. JGP012]
MRTHGLKRFASWSLSVLLGTSLLLTPLASESAQAAEADQETTITLLGTSDIHGRFMPWDYALDGPNPSGSMTQLYTMVKKVRSENPNTILLDAGDMIQDNSAELFNDQPQSPMMVAMNEMNYDAWVMGNHEFNFGLDVLEKISSQFKGQALVGNIFKENGDRYMPAYTIIERDGIKVGVIGMNTPMITEFEKGTNHLNGVTVKDPVEETRKAIAELKGKVDVMVGLMHMGLDNENGKPGTGVTDIAKANPELAAIFAGHMHQLIESQTVNGVLISEPNKYGTHLSRIDLKFAKEDGKVVLKSKEAKALAVKKADGTYEISDPALEQTLHPFHEFARADANIEVAELKGTNLVPADEIKGIPAVQIQETPLSDFFTEVMLHYSNADVVAHQIDNDKAKLDVGPIKKKDIAFNYQYTFGEVTVYEVTGRDLKDYMEWSAGYFNSTRPGDVTISFDPKRLASKYSTDDFFGGVTYEIDLTKPYGSRITNLKYSNGKAVQAADNLKLGMNAYRMEALIAKGGALEGRKFTQLWSSKDASAFGEIQGTIRNLSIAYLKDVMKGVYEPKIQHNWKITGVDLTTPERADVVQLINDGVMSVPTTEDGKYTNIASINILDAVTADEIEALSSKAGVDAAQFKGVKSKGAFYQQLNKARKVAAGKHGEDSEGGKNEAAAPAPEKPGTPAKPKPAPTPGTSKPDGTQPGKPSTSTGNSKPAPTASSKQARVTAAYLNVRAGASSKAKVITSVPKGTMLEVISTDHAYGWVKVKVDGRAAYVYGKYVTMLK